MNDNDDRRWLYERMQKAGVNTGNYDEFTASLNNKEDRDWYYQKSIDLGLDVGSADDFAGMMVSTPTQQPTQPQQPAGGDAAPLVHEKFAKQMQMQSTLGQMQQRMSQRADAIVEGNKPFGSHKGVQYNPTTQKFEDVYYTKAGEAVGSREELQARNAEIDAAMRPPTVSEELQAAYDERDNLDEAIRQRQEQLNERNRQQHDNGGFWANLGSSLMAAESPNKGMAPAGNTEAMEDPELSMLWAAKKQNKKRIQVLEREQGHDNFMQTLGKTLFSFDTWDFGLQDLMTAGTMLAYGNTKQGGKAGEAQEAMMRNALALQEAQARYSDNDTFWQITGEIAGNAIPFAVEFMTTGGGFSGISKATTKLASKAAAKMGANKFGKFVLKSTGILARDMALSFLMANTTGGMKTTANILERHQGHVTVDENGDYTFEGGKSLGRSIYEGEMASTIEYFTEKLGKSVFDKALGKWVKPTVGGWLSKGAEKMEAGRVSKLFSRIKGSEWGALANKVLVKGGIDSYPSEVLEEEAGILLNAMMKTGNNEFSDLWDGKTQAEIWGGMMLSIGFMKTPSAVGATYQTAQYYRYKHKTDVSDRVASIQLTPEVWRPLRDLIDGTTNEGIGAVVHDNIINNPDLQDAQKQAALDYVGNLMQMRGYDLRTTANARDKFANTDKNGIPAAPDAEVTAANEHYNTGYTADEEDRRDIAIELAMGKENSQDAWDGVRQRIEDDADRMVAELRQEDKRNEYREEGEMQGTLQPVTLKELDGDKKNLTGYIVSGRVVMNEDGSVNREESDHVVWVQIPGEEKPRNIDPAGDLGVHSLGEVESMEQREERYRKEREAYIQQKLDEASGKVTVQVGEQVQVPGTDAMGTVVAVSEDGEGMTVRLEDGTKVPVVRSDLQQVADAAALADYQARHGNENENDNENGKQPSTATPMVEGAPVEFTPGMEITIKDDEGNEKPATVLRRVRSENFQYVPDENGNIVEYKVDGQVKHDNIDQLAQKVVSHVEPVEVTQEAAMPTEEVQQSTTEQQPSTVIAEEEQPTIEPMPMREDGEPDFMASTPEQGHQYITEKYGEKAGRKIKATVEDKEKELDKAKKALDKAQEAYDNAPIGKEKKAEENLRKAQEAYDTAKTENDYWNGVKAVQNSILTAEAAERAERDRKAHEAAVLAEQQRQAEELAKRAEQEARGSNSVAAQITEKWNASPKVEGVENEITLANGETVKGRYMLVESGAATPSHNPNMEFARNEGFPIDENGQTVNDRDYERDQEAQTITRQMAERYDSRAIQSVPVVSRDGVVLSGNGRTMAGELAAQNGTDGAYIEHLKKYPQQFGFTTEQVEGMQHPRVVFVPDEAMPYTTETFAKFNQQDMKSQSRTEQAVKLGKTVDDATFGRIVSSINSFDTLGDFYNDSKAAPAAIGELHKAGVINQMQVAEMMDGEKISGQGRQMLENMLIGKAFESNPDAIRQLAEFPAMRQSVVAALAEVANNIKLGEEYSLMEEMSQAINLAYQARKSGGIVAGEKVSGFARQQSLFPFETGETVADYNNATVMMLADTINDSRVSQLKKVLALYNDKAASSAAGQYDIFSGGVKSKEEIIKEVLDILNYGTKRETQQALDGAAARRKDAAGVQEDGTDATGGAGSGNAGDGQGNLAPTQGVTYQDATAQPETATVSASSSDIETEPEGKRNGTATPQNGALSSGKDTNNSETGQKNDASGLNPNYKPKSERELLEQDKAHLEKTIAALEAELASNDPMDVVNHKWDRDTLKRNKERLKEIDERLAKLDAIAAAEAEVNTDPTEGQKKAGNYKKGHVKVDGYDITIENPKGSVRRGTDPSGKAWEQEMHNTYGYIRGTEGVDGDHIDVFLSDEPDDGAYVYVIDQVDPKTGEFDEHKVMYGYDNVKEATDDYLSNYEKGWQGLGCVTRLSKEDFKKWIESSHRKTKPCCLYRASEDGVYEGYGRGISNIAEYGGRRDVTPAGKPQGTEEREVSDEEFEDIMGQLDDIINGVSMEDFFSDDWGKGERQDIGVEMDGKTTLEQVRKLFDRFNKGKHSEELKALADKVFPLVERLNLEEITFSNDTEFNFGEQGRYGGRSVRYRHNYFTHPSIDNERKAHVLLHELVHSVTQYAIVDYQRGGQHLTEGMKDAVKTLFEVYEQIKEDAAFKGEYGTRSVNEMVAEMSNPAFKAKMKAKRLWQKVVDAIKRLFGIKTEGARETTAYDEVSKAMDYIMENFDADVYFSYSGRRAKTWNKKTTVGGSTEQSGADASSGGHVQSPSHTPAATLSVSFDDAKIRRFSQTAKSNIKKYRNGDTEINANGSVNQVLGNLRRFFGMNYAGNSNYAVYDTPRGRIAVRLANHNARGENFARDNAEKNISVYVALQEYEQPESRIPFTEYRITEADFGQHREEFIGSLVESFGNALERGEFTQPAYTTKQEYPAEAESPFYEQDFFASYKELTSEQKAKVQSIGTRAAMAMIERGKVGFEDFARAMVERLGDDIRPFLKSFYNGARDFPGFEKYDMTPYDEVRTFDVENFDKQGAKDIIKTAETIVREQEVEKEAETATNTLKNDRNAERKATKQTVKGNKTGQTSLFGEEETEQSEKEPAGKPQGTVEGQQPKSAVDEETAKVRRMFSAAVADEMLRGLAHDSKPFRSIVDLRKRAESVGMKVDAEGRDDILLQELVEDGLVRAARQVIESGQYGGSKSRQAYEAICKLYDLQPTIAQRSSNRIKMQQYSTPLPMAFVADMFAYRPGTRIGLEPTAGNGMLVFAVPANDMVVNELDETRLANLQRQGFLDVKNLDALTADFGGMYDFVIANPPFGSAEAKMYDGKSIAGLDPQIALNALSHMRSDGKAAIIIGGNMEYADNGSVKDKKPFWSYLYNHYNVKGVVDMEGKLYAKQGTTYPTRMILIDGVRSKEEMAQSTVYPPTRENAVRKAESFEELYDIVNEITNSKNKTNGTEVLRSNTNLADGERQTGDTDIHGSAVEHHADAADERGGRGRGNGVRDAGRNGDGGVQRPEEPSRERVRGLGVSGVSGAGASLSGNAELAAAGAGGNVVNGRGRQGAADNGESEQAAHGASGRDGLGRVQGLGDAGGGLGLGADSGGETAGNTTADRNRSTVEPEKRGIGDEKLSYRPHNSAFSLQSVAPAAMVEAMDKTLSDIEKKYDMSIDQFVTRELGYDSEEEMHRALAAEQVDSVAMAVHQMKQGNALIIGDQTGVGKGRQMAALIRWAVRQGKKPIFITQKADLFSDIYRDLVDVGSGDLRPFIFNAPGGKNPGEMVDANGKKVYVGASDKEWARAIKEGKLPEGYDYAVLTYSQVNTGDQISRESKDADGKRLSRGRSANKDNRDKAAPKADFLRKIAEDNYLFLDESHTAAGESNTGAYFRSIIGGRGDGGVRAVTFASATFAKRPDTMPMYALRTAMSQANVEPNKLISIIEKGGVTLQEIMSRALTESGQMVRRERDMSDVRTDWETVSDPATVKRARENYDKTIIAFNAIIRFQEMYVKPMIDMLDAAIAERMQTAKVKKGTDKSGIENTPFASKTYNYTKQLMLALKADAIVDRVEQEIKAGRHPVIALESTMEASLKDCAIGEAIDEPTFSASLLRGLDNCMQYTVKDEDGKESHHRFKPSDLGSEGEQAYYQLQDLIRESTKEVFISPLDAIIEKLHERGYKVGEMTGRERYVERRADGKVVVKKRTDRDKKRMQREFNSGALDVLILNKSASTGISLHASEKFTDQRQRSMIIAQPLSDINDYMQMIGRIDRTGQVSRGYYVNLGLPVPAESRFLMILSTKLKSLNANTTTSQESESSSVEAPDLLNKYGSQVVIEYLRDNPDIYSKMGDPLKLRDKKNKENSIEELLEKAKPGSDEEVARKITGYVALLSTAEQEAFYNDVVQRYTDLIKYLDSTGTNDLKITVMPLRAKTLTRSVSSEGKDPNGSNPFASNAYVEQVEMDVLRKPMKAEEVRKLIEQMNTPTGSEKGHLATASKEKEAGERVMEIVGQVQRESDAKLAAEEERYAVSKQKAQEEMEKWREKIDGQERTEAEKKEAIERKKEEIEDRVEKRHVENSNVIKSRTTQLVQMLQEWKVGNTYLLPQNMSEADKPQIFKTPAIFCGYKVKKSGITPSTSFAVFATLDGRRRIEVKFTDNSAVTSIRFLTEANWNETREITLDNWDSKTPTESRKKGYIMTGNILQAVADTQTELGNYPGQLISYSDEEGNIHDGILMPDRWEPSLLRTSGTPIEGVMGKIRNYVTVESVDGKVKLYGSSTIRRYYLEVPKSKKEGRQYFENEAILRNTEGIGFYEYRGKLRADIPASKIDAVVMELGRLGVRVKKDEEDTNRRHRMVDDSELIERLEREPKERGYRNVVLNADGTLGSPMASKLGKKGAGRTATSGFAFDSWEQADENPDMATDEGKIDLIKPDGKTVGGVDYNPYIHIRPTLVNKQFKQAWERPNLVYVETEYPASELTSGYKAEKAKKAVGRHDWNGGELILSRWDKPVRIVPWEQVADDWEREFAGRGVEFDIIPPRLLPILAERGVEILPPHKGMGKACEEAYERWKADPEGYYGQPSTAVRREGESEADGISYGDWFDQGSVERIGAFRGDSRKRIDAMRSRQEKSVRNRFNGIVEKLGLSDRVMFVDDADDFPGEVSEDDRRSKGWYDIATGKIVIVLGNHSSSEDVVASILHEGVGHYGLRELFGEHFNTFLDNVYASADERVRRAITELASSKYGYDFRKATEEYISSLAEDTDFENPERQSWWTKIKDLFWEMLHKLGIAGQHIKDAIGDNELRYLLWRSYQNLVNPGRYRSLIEEAEDVAMQWKLKVGRYEEQYGELKRARKGRWYESEQRETESMVREDEGGVDEKGNRVPPKRYHRDMDGTPRVAARERYEKMLASSIGQATEAFQDSMYGLKAAYESIMKAEGKKKAHADEVKGYENAYLAENRMSSATKAQQHAWEQEFMEPVTDEVAKITGRGLRFSRAKLDELTDYMMAKHGLERNVVFAERDARKAAMQGKDYDDELQKNRGRDYAGLTALTGKQDVADAEAKAQQMVDDFEAQHDTTELWEAINRATKDSLYTLASAGMMSAERHQQVRDMFEYYIPLQGFDENTAEDEYTYLGNYGMTGGGNPLKRAEGRKSKADNPLAMIANNGKAAIRIANRNLMKQHFLRFVESHPSDLVSVSDVWLKHNDVTDEWEQYFDAGIQDGDSAAEVARKVETFEQTMEQLSASDPDHYKRGRDLPNIPYRVLDSKDMNQHQVRVMQGGKTVMLTINGNPRAAQALNGLTNPDVRREDSFGAILNVLQDTTRRMSLRYTSASPNFVVSNYFLDALYSNLMTWVKEDPKYAINFHKNYLKMNTQMARLFIEWERGSLRKNVKNGSASRLEKMFHDFMMEGGETGWTAYNDIEKEKKLLEKVIKVKGTTNDKVWTALYGTLGIANRAVENCARFAAFVTSREMGRSVEFAIRDAKEVSVNFNRKGASDRFFKAKGQTAIGNVSALVSGLGRGNFAFWNAGLQGLIGNFAKNIVRHPAKGAGMLGVLTALGYFIPVIVKAIGGDDDDEYYDIPEYVRRSNICFRWRNDMPWITIPLPIEFRAEYGLGELTSGVISGKERYSQDEMYKQYIAQVSQLLPLDFMEGGGGWHAFVPTYAKPSVEAAANESWTGLPIYRPDKYDQYGEGGKPQWQRAYASADRNLVSLTRWLNNVTISEHDLKLAGGNVEDVQGSIDWNPAAIEYVLKGYLGGPYTFASQLWKTGETVIGRREFEWRNVPLANRLLREGDERTEMRKVTNEYFNLLSEYNNTKHLLKQYEQREESGNETLVEKAERVNFLNNDPAYLRYLIIDSFKPVLDAYYNLGKEAEGEEKAELKATEDALRKQCVELVHAVDEGKEVDVDAEIERVLGLIIDDEGTDVQVVKKAQKAWKKHQKQRNED